MTRFAAWHRLVLVAVAATLLLARSGVAWAQTTTDEQLWIFGEGQAELTKKLRLDLEQQLRLDQAATGFDETFTELGLHYRLLKPLRVGGFYRAIFLDGETRHRVGGDGEARVGFGRVELSYRLRLQYTTRDQGGRTALRNRLKIAVDAPYGLVPFAAGELIYVFEKSELREERLYLGVEFAVTKRTGLSAFYLLQNEINVNAPERNHVLGLGLTWTVFEHAKKAKPELGEGGDGAVAGSSRLVE